MSSAAENGDAAPGKQNEEKTYKKVSILFFFSSTQKGSNSIVWKVNIAIGLLFFQSNYL